MNTVVSDTQNIVNIQGIRYVSWGELATASYTAPQHKFHVTVTYKSNHTAFYYKDAVGAQELFNKIREAMDKTYQKI